MFIDTEVSFYEVDIDLHVYLYSRLWDQLFSMNLLLYIFNPVFMIANKFLLWQGFGFSFFNHLGYQTCTALPKCQWSESCVQ